MPEVEGSIPFGSIGGSNDTAKGYSKNFERDFEFYQNNLDLFDFSGSPAPGVVYDPEGPSAKRCFHIFDSEGKLKPCSEPELLSRLLLAKASVNWHIKAWAEGRADGTFPGIEFYPFLESIGAPDWVTKAVNRQWMRILRRNQCP